MGHNFRLLRASGVFNNKTVQQDLYDESPQLLEVEFSGTPDQTDSNSWISVVIGKNGIGKSRVLAGIANVFELRNLEKKYLRSRKIMPSLVEYQIDDKVCRIEISAYNEVTAFINNDECLLKDVPLPQKVIVLTTTPFDKFSLPKFTPSRRYSGKPNNYSYIEEKELYSYLGLRDSRGRASSTAALFRALGSIFEASQYGEGNKKSIAGVFNFLGYEPRIEVVYEINNLAQDRLVKIIDSQHEFDFDVSNFSSKSINKLKVNSEELGLLKNAGKRALSAINSKGEFKLSANFDGQIIDDDFFHRVQILRDHGLMKMKSVFLERITDGARLDLQLASSGELGIVISFLGIASVIKDGSLIFIDEPEISLHPEWQTKYIKLLVNTFQHYKNCHFIIATHSPLILSDISVENSNVISLEPGKSNAGEAANYAGKSTDRLLATVFDAPGKNNLFIKQQIVKAMRMAADSEIESTEFQSVLKTLVEISKNLREESPAAELIRQLVTAAEEAKAEE